MNIKKIKEIINEAQNLRKEKKLKEALEKLELINLNEENNKSSRTSYILYLKAKILGEMGRKKEAHKFFTNALSFSKSAKERIYIKVGDYEIRCMYLDAYFTIKEIDRKNSLENKRTYAKSLINDLLLNKNLNDSLKILEEFNNSNYSTVLLTKIKNLLQSNTKDYYLWAIFGKFMSYYGYYDKSLKAFEYGLNSPLMKFESTIGIIHCAFNFKDYEKVEYYIDSGRKIAKTDEEKNIINSLKFTLNNLLKKEKKKQDNHEEQISSPEPEEDVIIKSSKDIEPDSKINKSNKNEEEEKISDKENVINIEKQNNLSKKKPKIIKRRRKKTKIKITDDKKKKSEPAVINPEYEVNGKENEIKNIEKTVIQKEKTIDVQKDKKIKEYTKIDEIKNSIIGKKKNQFSNINPKIMDIILLILGILVFIIGFFGGKIIASLF